MARGCEGRSLATLRVAVRVCEIFVNGRYWGKREKEEDEFVGTMRSVRYRSVCFGSTNFVRFIICLHDGLVGNRQVNSHQARINAVVLISLHVARETTEEPRTRSRDTVVCRQKSHYYNCAYHVAGVKQSVCHRVTVEYPRWCGSSSSSSFTAKSTSTTCGECNTSSTKYTWFARFARYIHRPSGGSIISIAPFSDVG